MYEAQALATGDESLLTLADGARQVVLQMLAPVNMKPGPGHAGAQLRAAFERNCIALELKGIARPAELSTYEYYSRVAYLEEQRPAPKE